MSEHLSKRVVVAMSGGVDSSVAAYLLKKQGFEVIGVSLKVWEDEKGTISRGKTCCSFNDIEDARKVCSQLEIPFYAFNYKKEFEKEVIDPFVNEYYLGRTPNPCILCNQHIKFDRLFKEAEKLGATYLATGHHARIAQNDRGIFHLLKGADTEKDQSYVLYSLKQEELKKILFPVGKYSKNEVRKVAKEAKLPTASKRESQDICFIPDGDHDRFIRENYPRADSRPGNFVDSKGKVLGRHHGIHAYTIGQRRGLGIGFRERLYVTRIDSKKNEIELGLKEETFSDGLIAKGVSWLVAIPPKKCGVKIRYQKSEIPSDVEVDQSENVVVHFKEPAPAVTPGQAVVFYRGDEVLGGGIIEQAIFNDDARSGCRL